MRPKGLARARLRTRVLAGVVTITLLALIGFDIAAVTALRGYLLRHADSRLRSVLILARPLPVTPGFARGLVLDGPRLPPPGQHAPAGSRGLAQRGHSETFIPSILNQYRVAFVPGHGPPRVLLPGPGLAPRLPPGLPAIAGGPRAQTVTGLGGRAQLRLQAVPADGGTLVATTSLAEVNSTVGRLELIMVAGSAAAGLLVALGVILIVRRGVRPIEAMAAQADRITAGDLTQRVSPQDPRTEVGRLGAALNGMLTRIQAAISEREASQDLTRRFFADASHELRNPLASLRANAELYQQGALAGPPQVDQAMHRIALEARRMSSLVDDMLRLARLDQHPGRQHDPVDLSALLTECAQRAQTTSPARTWHTRITPALTTRGDQELLRRAIDNLLANVHAHTPPGTTATITATQAGPTITLQVSDTGPGVPAPQLPRIFDRFYRASPPVCPPGSGLGLAIVTAITTTHHGTARATLNHPHGLRITLTLPATSPPPHPPDGGTLAEEH